MTEEQIATIVGESWAKELFEEFHKQYIRDILNFIKEDRKKYEVFPPHKDMFRAFIETPFNKVRVVIVGQDPYHTPGMADGLAFSVRSVPDELPPSLKNIFKEMETDLGFLDPSPNPDLTRLARQGVFLLNTTLTVRKGVANSHSKVGWDIFTSAVLQKIAERFFPTIFVAWGGDAERVINYHLDPMFHTIIKSSHPSPRSCHRGFFGSKPFFRINEALRSMKEPEIDWYKNI